MQEKAQGLFEQGKRLAKIYLGNTPVDFTAREESDKAAGVVRLTDENWDREMAAWDGDWAIIMCVPLHPFLPVARPAVASGIRVG